MTNEKILGYTTPCDTEPGKTDAQRMIDAIFRAKTLGLNKTVIPRYNAQKGECKWVLTEEICVPEDMVLVLDNCEIELAASGAILVCGTMEEPVRNVKITGSGNARISCKDEERRAPLIRMENAKRVTLSGLTVENGYTRGILLRNSETVKIRDICFLNEVTEDDIENARVSGAGVNARGIVICGGCSHIRVTDIIGTTLGDTVEITPFSQIGEARGMGKITDITVKNVQTDCFVFSNLSVKNGDGNIVSCIYAENISDTSEEGSNYRGEACVSIGENRYGFPPSQPGETRNFTVKNIITRSANAVKLSRYIEDITIADVTVKADGGVALGCAGELLYQNIYLCNIKFEPRCAPAYPINKVRKESFIETPLVTENMFYPYRATCNIQSAQGNGMKINGVYAQSLDNLMRMFGKNYIDIFDVSVGEIVYDDLVGDIIVMD